MPDIQNGLYFICPHCEEALTSVDYRQPVVATDYGTVSIEMPLNVMRWGGNVSPPCMADLEHDYNDRSDGDASDDPEYLCPECNEDIDRRALDEYIAQHSVIVAGENFTRSSPYATHTPENTVHIGGTGQIIDTRPAPPTRTTAEITTCESCGKALCGALLDSCCPSCGAELPNH